MLMSELFYAVERNGMYAAGKAAFTAVGGAASVATMGLTSALSAGLTQMDFVHKKNMMRDEYKQEIAAKLHKSIDKVTTKDLELLAENDPMRGTQANQTFAEELKKSKRVRNFGIVFSVVASLAAIAVVAAINPAIFTSIASAVSNAGMAEWLATGAKFLAKGLVAVAAYNVIKAPIHWMGDKLFGLDKETTHDRIDAIRREREEGKTISQEQVLGVFISANKPLASYIEAQTGKGYDAMTYPEKHAIAEAIGPQLNLAGLTEQINRGSIRATELAFTVEGDLSGVLPKAPEAEKRQGMIGKIKYKLSHLVERVNEPDFDSGARNHAQEKPLDARKATKVQFDNDVPDRNFAGRFARPRSEGISHVQQVDQSRADAALGRATP